MNIVFFCQSCGARFEVDPRMAGKKGHCKKCGQYMSIPRAQEIASMAAMPALATAAAGAVGGPAPGSGAVAVPAPTGNWLARMTSQVGLAPITIDRMPAGRKKPSMFAEDDLADSKPYALAKPERRGSGGGGGGSGPAGVVTRVWRGQLGGVQKLFRKISETAYVISIPFLLILLFGAAVSNRSMALFGATVVVLLNIGRLVAGAANLAVVPLRDGINFQKMKKPLRRVIEPVVTIGLVFLAFIFIPWLSAAQVADGSVADRIRSGAQALKEDMKGQVDQVVDVDKFGAQVQGKLKELGDKAKDVDLKQLGAQGMRNSRNSVRHQRAVRPSRTAPAASARPSRPSRSAPRRRWTRPRPSMSHGNSPEPIPDEPNPIDQTNLRDRVMSTPTTDDLPHAAEVIELEPTMTMELFQSGAGSASGSYRPRPAVGIGEGSLASLAGETETLRRRRLFAAAVSLTATFGVLCVWVFASDNPGTLTAEGSRYSLRVGLIGLRCLLAVSVAGLLASEVPLCASNSARSSTCCSWA